MKKLLFILVAILSLCACSSSDDESVSNNIVYESKSYPIEKACLDGRHLYLRFSGNYCVQVLNCDFEVGKKNYLTAFEYALAFVGKVNNEHMEYLYFWDTGKIKDDSYVTIKKNDEDNRIYIEVYINNGLKVLRAKYLGVLSDYSNFWNFTN